MKPDESYLAMVTRLKRHGSNQAAAKTGADGACGEKATVADANSVTAANQSTVRSLFAAQKVAAIKLQFASGNYRVDTDALAAKILDAGVLGSDLTF